jgi:hypothetical protein
MKCSTVNVSLALALGTGLALVLAGALSYMPPRAQAQEPAELHVAPSCAGIPNCYTTVQAAVDAASDGAVIKVAAGTYTDLHTAVVAWKTITQVVYIHKSVTIRGGYTGTNWEMADPVANPTVLDARERGRVLYVSPSVTFTIEGLCITGGDAAGLGGGPLGEDSGGGVYVSANLAVIRDNRVFSNTADYGGGLYLGAGIATLSGSTVTSNTADYGGGLFLADSDATLRGNTVASNTAGYGGGVFLSSRVSTLKENAITANAAITSGGGLLLLRSDDAVLNANIVVANVGGTGGGLYLDRSDAALTNNIVAGNRASTAGSGLYVLASSPRLLHTTIAQNNGSDSSGLCVTGYRRDETYYFSTVALTNTILVDHAVGITVAAGNTATLEATLWGTGAWANGTDWSGAGAVVTGTPAHNYWGHPDFADPGTDDYHIGVASAAIDEGMNAGVGDDVDGDPRPQGSGYDLGADETGLVVVKQAIPPLVKPGAQLNYAIRVTNTSFVTLTAAITDILPDHVTPADPLTWRPVTITPGNIWTQTVVVTVLTGYAGTLTNVLQVTTDKGPGGAYTETSLAGHGIYLPLVLRSL